MLIGRDWRVDKSYFYLLIYCRHNYYNILVVSQDMQSSNNPYDHTLTELKFESRAYKYYDFSVLNPETVKELPISVKILLECAVRNCD